MLTAAVIMNPAVMYAADFKCIGERIEKSGSTWGTFKESGSEYRIEKSGYTIARVINRSGKWAVEDTGSNTLAWINGSRIEKQNGSSWADLSDAKSFCDGPDQVAAAMWVLSKLGKL